MPTAPLNDDTVARNSLSERLKGLHQRLLSAVAGVDRIGCALYDESDDTLRTFINSTREGHAISAYAYKLSDSQSLSEMAKTGVMRVIDDIQSVLRPVNRHTEWLLDQGYQSSFTVPIYDRSRFLGFVFYDSMQSGAFTTRMQRDLVLFANLINMTISNEFAVIRSVRATVGMARDLAKRRDFETGAHLERVARTCRIIATSVAGKFNLSDEFIEHVYLFAPLHDIGKIEVADSILLKKGPLDAQERAAMKQHVRMGVEIVERILHNFQLEDFSDSQVMHNIVAYHHEALDGSGYPNGLKGDEIPVEARIVAVADVLDALASERPYKPAWSFGDVLAELRRMAQAGKLDPDCVDAIEQNAPEVEMILTRYQDQGELP